MADSMYNPLITVIVPVYNAEKYLKKCLESLIHQTYRNLEIICVDDESQDGSGQIMDEYAGLDPRIKAIHLPHCGVSATRNAGHAVATGEWITSLDSDDYLDLDLYEKAVGKLTDEMDILAFGTRLIYEPGVPNDGLEQYFRLPEEGMLEPGDVRRARINVCFCTKLWRRSFIEGHGLKFPDGYVHEDDYMYRCLAPHARGIYVFPQVGYNYVQHPRSIIHSDKTDLQKYQDKLHIIDMIISFHASNGMVDRAREYILPFWANYWFSIRDAYPAELVRQTMQLNSRVISRHSLESVLGDDYRLRALMPQPRWKLLFVKTHMRGITYRFFGIHLFTVVYENDRPSGWESAWLKLPKRLLGRKG